MNETIHWEQHEPFRISILGQVISHETILWLCPLRKICWEMSDIKQHWCSLLENFSYLLCFAGLAWVQIKKKFVQVKNNSLFRSSEAAVAAVLSDIVYPIRHPDPFALTYLTFDVSKFWIQHAYSGPSMNAQISREQLEHVRISFYCQVILGSVIMT